MRAILHIGNHKTGTTAIQNVCFHSAEALSQQGFYYPTNDTKWRGHHPLARALKDTTPTAVNYASGILGAYIEATGSRTLLLSSEDLCLLEEDRVRFTVNFLRQYVEEVDVVCYYRHPVEWLVSSYKWHIMKGRFTYGTFQTYLNSLNLKEKLDYLSTARKWSSTGVNFIPRVYARDVIGDFLSLIGASLSSSTRSNESPRNLTTMIAAQLGARGLITKESIPALEAAVRHTCGSNDLSLIDPATYKQIMDVAKPTIDGLACGFSLPCSERLQEEAWQPSRLDTSLALEATIEFLLSLELNRSATCEA